MFTGVEYDGGDGLGKAIFSCFVVWLVWTMAIVWMCSKNEGRLSQSSGGSYALSIAGSGIAFILLSSILLLVEFYLAFSGSTIYRTEQIPASTTVFWAICNLLVATIIITWMVRVIKEDAANTDKATSNADVVWFGSAALSFLGMGLLWLGILFMPGFYTAENLFSLRQDIKGLIIGLIVLPIILVMFWGFVQWCFD